MKNRPLSLFIVLLFIASSCSIIGLNVKRKTPKKPGKYPEFTLKDTLRGQITEYRKGYDISFYAINIDVNIDDKYIKGYVDIHFTALNDLDTIQLDLYENLSINKVVYASDSLKTTRKFNAVYVAFNEKIKKDEECIIRVYYEGKPIIAPRPPWEGGFVWKKDKNKNPWVGVSCELDGASLWWPLKDHLYDEPDSLQMNVTIPKGLFCVSNGKLIERKIEGDKETFSWKTSYSINSYNATLYIGDFKHFTIPYKSETSSFDLDFYVLPYNLETAKEHFKQVEGIIAFFEDTFGEYPWQKDGYKLIESPYSGMEHQSAIAYGDKYKNSMGNDFDYIILHETAHEWWGNSVSASDYAEIWLHEGFATYSEALYVEHTKGYDEYINYLAFYSMLIKNKRPLIGPFDVNYWTYKDSDVYLKGALLLHSLRNLIDNDPLFFDIIKTFYTRHKYSITTTKDFITLVHEKTNQDFNWFFEQYLYNRTCPQLEWHYFYNVHKAEFELRYRWINVGDDFKLPVVVKTEDGNKTLYPSLQLQTIKMPSGESIQLNLNNSYISLKKNKNL